LERQNSSGGTFDKCYRKNGNSEYHDITFNKYHNIKFNIYSTVHTTRHCRRHQQANDSQEGTGSYHERTQSFREHQAEVAQKHLQQRVPGTKTQVVSRAKENIMRVNINSYEVDSLMVQEKEREELDAGPRLQNKSRNGTVYVTNNARKGWSMSQLQSY
jgi:hypothetical protein